jgi:hypothetical protein
LVTKEILLAGAKFDIYIVRENGVSQVSDFIESLQAPEIDSKVSQRLDAFRDHGPSKNTQHFRHEGNGIYAVKTKDVRLYGFFHGKQCFVLAVGFLKNKTGGRNVERRYCDKAVELRTALDSDREG